MKVYILYNILNCISFSFHFFFVIIYSMNIVMDIIIYHCFYINFNVNLN